MFTSKKISFTDITHVPFLVSCAVREGKEEVDSGHICDESSEEGGLFCELTNENLYCSQPMKHNLTPSEKEKLTQKL